MSELIQLGASPLQPAFARPSRPSTTVLWLQSVTLAWMLAELGVSVFASVTARSPAMMAFGSDSLVELLSAGVVLLQWIPKMSISERKAHRASAVLLFALAFLVGIIALGSLVLRLRPDVGWPRGKRSLPYPVVRFACRFGGDSNSHSRGQIRLARARVRLLLTLSLRNKNKDKSKNTESRLLTGSHHLNCRVAGDSRATGKNARD